jgi:AcrR family transcriptional regulator
MKNDKHLKMLRVGRVALELIDRHGLEAVQFARVARAAKVSRPWLYEYIGKTRESLVKFAVESYGKWLAELEVPSHPPNAKEWVSDRMSGISTLLDNALGFPALIRLYFNFRGTPNIMGRAIAEIEHYYLDLSTRRIRTALKVSSQQARFIARINLAIDMGLAYEWIHNPGDKKELIKLARIVKR